jgi:hypothetical protein
VPWSDLKVGAQVWQITIQCCYVYSSAYSIALNTQQNNNLYIPAEQQHIYVGSPFKLQPAAHMHLKASTAAITYRNSFDSTSKAESIGHLFQGSLEPLALSDSPHFSRQRKVKQSNDIPNDRASVRRITTATTPRLFTNEL